MWRVGGLALVLGVASVVDAQIEFAPGLAVVNCQVDVPCTPCTSEGKVLYVVSSSAFTVSGFCLLPQQLVEPFDFPPTSVFPAACSNDTNCLQSRHGGPGFYTMAGHNGTFPEVPLGYDDIPDASYDAHARLKVMDEEGIYAMVLYPNLGGFGNFTGSFQLAFSNFPGGASTALVFGVSQVNFPIFGGTLVPAPLSAPALMVDPAGNGFYQFNANFPAGTTLYFQALALDAGAPAGISFSNAISATAP